MRIILEGMPEEVDQGTTLAQLIESRQEDTVHLIAEVNHRFIHRRDYRTTVLKEGDQVELIHPAFGG
jgi:thiamine biosynthesis protein ThiS